MAISLRALCTGRRGVTSDEIQANIFFTVQLQRYSRKSILLIHYKTKYVAKKKASYDFGRLLHAGGHKAKTDATTFYIGIYIF